MKLLANLVLRLLVIADFAVNKLIVPVPVDGNCDGRAMTRDQFMGGPWREGRRWVATPDALQRSIGAENLQLARCSARLRRAMIAFMRFM